MAQITAGTAKNAVMILKINNRYLKDVSQNAYMRGHYRFEYINDNEWGIFSTLYRDSTQIASLERGTTYIRITLNDSSIKADGFNTQPPVTGGTPTFTVSATDSNYLTSGAWTYDNSYYQLVSFTSNDSSTVPVTGVTLNTSAHTISIDSTYNLVATVSPSDAGNKSVTWTSTNTAVATVSSSGVVNAVGSGTATITATTVDGGFTATCVITVVVLVYSVTLPSDCLLLPTTTSTLTATISPDTATDKTLTWTSSNPSVATVDSSGTVTPVSVGIATITATTSNGKTGSCAVEVVEPITPTRAPVYKYSISAADTVLEGGSIFGDSTDVTNLFDTWTNGNLTYAQTANGIAWIKTSGYGMISPWLAFNKYQDYSVEVEFYQSSGSVLGMGTALVWYPNENRYAHLPKPAASNTTAIGYVKRDTVSYFSQTVAWSTARDKWIKLRHDYRYADGNGYIKGSVTIDGSTWTSEEVMVDSVTNFPNPTVAPTIWQVLAGTMAYRNLKVVSGALSAYSFDTTRASGGGAVYTTKANGGTWIYSSANSDYRNGNMILKMPADAIGYVTGTGTFTLPQLNLPQSSSFEYMDIKTSDNAGGTIAWELRDTNGVVKQSGVTTDGYNHIPITATDKSLQPFFTFSGSTAKLNFVDVSWTTPTPNTLTYNANGGTGTIASETGFEFVLANAGFTREGYRLAGWNTAADGSGTFYELGASASFISDTTLYAVWTSGLPLYIGSQQVQKLYIGNQEVLHLYKGSTLIF